MRIALYVGLTWAILIIAVVLLLIPIERLVPGGPLQLLVAGFLLIVLVSFLRASIAQTIDLTSGRYDRERRATQRKGPNEVPR